MSCACEHKKLSGEIDRMRRLAKKLAVAEGSLCVIVRHDDGTYDFMPAAAVTENLKIIEYVSEY